MGIKGKHIVILIISLATVVVACAPKVRQSILTTFFDGVPPLEDKSLAVGIDTLGQVDSTKFLATGAAFRSSKITYHEPFKNKECSSCHNQLHIGKLVEEEPQLCYQCHKENKEKYSFKHGPAGAGFCTSCHNPHKAEADNLLVSKGEELCFNCHNSERVYTNKIHQSAKEKENCVSCHNPHSSESKFMLQPGACNSCHSNKINDFTFLHGPVGGNYCSTCHESHSSKNEFLLVKTGQELCLNCHNPSDIFKNIEHKSNKDKNCAECHSPHGGENRFLLN